MNLETSLARALAESDANAIDLAHCRPFRLGCVEVVPASRLLRTDGGPATTIQPLAMRVLIALHSAAGETCSRDDLVQACWNQRIVGDDAVHRIISTLRRDLARVSGGAVAIETIPKVGYRLVSAGPANPVQPDVKTSSASASNWRRSALLGGGALAMAAAASVAATLIRPAATESFTIGVQPVYSDVSDREARRFANDVTSDLARLAGAASRIDLIDSSLETTKSVDLFVRVTVERDGEAMSARASLVDAENGSIILARDFRDEGGNFARLRDRTALGLANVITCGLERSAGTYDDLALRRLYFAACDALESEDLGRAESLIRQLVARKPGVAAGWACLAQLRVIAESSSDDERRRASRSARGYAERAIRLDPNSGRGYAALAVTWGDSDPRNLATIERGLRADPEHASLYSLYAASLFNAGYVAASVAPAQRALALNPASRFNYGSSVRRLLAAGRPDEAFAVQSQAERLFPGSPVVLEHRLRLLPYRPDPAEALAEFERAQAGSADARQGGLQELELRWRADPRSVDLAMLERSAQAAFAAEPASAWHSAAVLSRLGHSERALEWLARAPRRGARSQWSLLFWPEAAQLRRDPRFFRAVADLGLVDVWRQRGQWPDFCAEPGLRYSCADEARSMARTRKTV